MGLCRAPAKKNLGEFCDKLVQCYSAHTPSPGKEVVRWTQQDALAGRVTSYHRLVRSLVFFPSSETWSLRTQRVPRPGRVRIQDTSIILFEAANDMRQSQRELHRLHSANWTLCHRNRNTISRHLGAPECPPKLACNTTFACNSSFYMLPRHWRVHTSASGVPCCRQLTPVQRGCAPFFSVGTANKRSATNLVLMRQGDKRTRKP